MFISELLLLNFLVGLGPGVSLLCSSLFLFDLKRKMKSIMCNLGYVVVSHVKVCLLLDPSIILQWHSWRKLCYSGCIFICFIVINTTIAMRNFFVCIVWAFPPFTIFIVKFHLFYSTFWLNKFHLLFDSGCWTCCWWRKKCICSGSLQNIGWRDNWIAISGSSYPCFQGLFPYSSCYIFWSALYSFSIPSGAQNLKWI